MSTFLTDAVNLVRQRFSFRDEEELVRQDAGSASYVILLVAVSIIATFGILVDKAEITIGAVLLAPTMIPLLSLSVGIAHGRAETILNALAHISMSILVVVTVAFFLTFLIPVVDIPEEAKQRAQPHIVDLLVAFCAGAVGMYAFLHKDVPESLAGVAVSVSLVLPLTVVGMGLAWREPLLSLGATVMFFTNLIAVIAAAVAVLMVYGRRGHTHEAREVSFVSTGLTIAIGGVMAVLLSSAFWQAYQDEKQRIQVKEELTAVLEQNDASLVEVESVTRNGVVEVQAIARLPEDAPDLSVRQLNNELVYRLARSVRLELSVVRIQLAERDITPDQQTELQEMKKVVAPDELDSAALEEVLESATTPTQTEFSTASSEADIVQ